MNTFWSMAAGLMRGGAGATLFALLTLVGRRASAVIGVVVTSLLVTACNPDVPKTSGQMQDGAISPEHAKMIGDLSVRLKQNPDDGKGWAMLARTYVVTKRYSEAVEAYERAANLIRNDAVMLVDYADVLAMVNGKKLQGKPLELIRQALKIDPNNVKGMALMGSAAFQDGDYKQAEKYWSKLLPMLPPDSQLAKQMSAGIADARALAGKQPRNTSGESAGMMQAVNGAARIAGVVELSPALSGKVAPTDTVFVFAKAMSGPPMPIAVMRAQAGELPIRFVLDDSMAMMPEMKLSGHKSVIVSAKISKSGSATQQSGDLRGEVSSVKVGASNVRVVIDSIAP